MADYSRLPVHPDAHRDNYVITAGQPYLIDWDGVDVSDVVRDVGVQMWGFLPHRRWNEFLSGGGLRPSAEVDAAVYWWSAFRMLGTALWVDDGAFHAHLFQRGRQARWVA